MATRSVSDFHSLMMSKSSKKEDSNENDDIECLRLSPAIPFNMAETDGKYTFSYGKSLLEIQKDQEVTCKILWFAAYENKSEYYVLPMVIFESDPVKLFHHGKWVDINGFQWSQISGEVNMYFEKYTTGANARASLGGNPSSDDGMFIGPFITEVTKKPIHYGDNSLVAEMLSALTKFPSNGKFLPPKDMVLVSRVLIGFLMDLTSDDSVDSTFSKVGDAFYNDLLSGGFPKNKAAEIKKLWAVGIDNTEEAIRRMGQHKIFSK